MPKAKKVSRPGVKPPKAASPAKKIRSLSELRDLQRQASSHASGGMHETGHESSGSPGALPAQKKRPHRFLPPRSGPVISDDRRNVPGMPETPETPATTVPRNAATPAPGRQPNAFARPEGVPGSTATAPTLSADDVALFRRVVESVTPRPKTDRLILPPVPPASPTQLKERRQYAMGQSSSPALEVSDQYASPRLEHDDTIFLQAGQGPHLIKALKKGKWPVQANLDLHGSTLDQARERMDRFIQSCRDHQIRCVRIVHGKGYGSKDGNPVLKETVRRWLSQLAAVQAYIESDEANGGAGAVLVLLSKHRPDAP